MAFMFSSFRILICFYVLFPLVSLEVICPGQIYPAQGLHYARIESIISGRANEKYAKIRIKLLFDPLIEGTPYKQIVQEATDFWANVLSVKPVDGRIFMSRYCESENKTVYKDMDGSGMKQLYCLGSCASVTKCDNIEIPSEHLDGCKYCNEEGQNCTKDQPESGTGVENADLVFYVSAIDATLCFSGPYIAYAGPCDLDPALDRPVFAQINICPTEAAKFGNDVVSRTIKHEVMHALGFGYPSVKFFRDKEGKPLWPRAENGLPIAEDAKNVQQKVLLNIPREWHVRGGKVLQSERSFLVTPNVVREVRAHFGCTDLEGAELENYGGTGTKFQHFEARVFFDDSMKGTTDTGKGLFSRFDFAVLDDSGWYKVDYSQAEKTDFGRNLGCDFYQKSCKFWMDKQRKEGKSIEPYCETIDILNEENVECIGSKQLFSGCPLGKLTPDYIKKLHDPMSSERRSELPLLYQNFDNISGVSEKEVTAYGNFDKLPDLCPIPVQNWDIKSVQIGINKPECEEESKPAEKPKPEEEPKTAEKPTEKPKPEEEPKTAEKPKPTEKPKTEEEPKTAEKPKPTEKPKPEEEPKTAEKPKPTEKQKPEEEPKTAEKPKPTIKPKPTEKPKPEEEPKTAEKPEEKPKAVDESEDEEHQKANQTSRFLSSVLLVTFFIVMGFML